LKKTLDTTIYQWECAPMNILTNRETNILVRKKLGKLICLSLDIDKLISGVDQGSDVALSKDCLLFVKKILENTLEALEGYDFT